ncbi:MAG: Bro-N domain-containing protein [Bacteroidales bacterium]|nr:Bro-N domain-containing protein [Bacteroidales bacterium]
MSDVEKIQLFEDQKVRTIWIENEEKWYFSIKDVVLILADAKDPKDYLSKMRRREPELAKGWGQIVHPLVVRTPGGPQKENFANLEGMFRIIQSIPSKKAEPFKRWLAQVGAERNSRPQVGIPLRATSLRSEATQGVWGIRPPVYRR